METFEIFFSFFLSFLKKELKCFLILSAKQKLQPFCLPIFIINVLSKDQSFREKKMNKLTETKF